MNNPKLQAMIDKFKENNPNKQLVLLYEAGSHFFNLNGPNSDTDYRGLYIDVYQDSYRSAGKVYQVDYKTKEGSGKNSKDDVDFTLFSLSSFLKLLKMGDFNMIEMLYTPEDKILFKTPIYDELVTIRDQLVVNDISAFLGFIKKEYKLYGVNIFHCKIQEDFSKFLKQWPGHDKLSKHWNEIVEYSTKDAGVRISATTVNNSDQSKLIPAVVLAKRMHISTESVAQVTGVIDSVLLKYGNRQKQMSESGDNFKGLYHALRLIYEANDIYDHGRLILPFSKERHSLLKKIKDGDIDKEALFKLIDDEIEKLEKRESEMTSNRPIVEDRIERIVFNLKGKMGLIPVNKQPTSKVVKSKENHESGPQMSEYDGPEN